MTTTESSASPTAGPCRICEMNTKYTHSANEHAVAEQWADPLVDYVKVDAFSRGDRPLTYAAVIDRFHLDTTVRRVGRVLDAVERILVLRGWPTPAAAGITAYVVNAGSRQPGQGWMDIWNMKPEVAREQARAHVRELTLGVDQ